MSFCKIDTVPFPKIFKQWEEEDKDLDNDDHRYKIKHRVLKVEDYPGQEHLVCIPSQLNAEGKYRKPKKLMEAERRGFKNVIEMLEADKKAEEDKKVKEQEDMKKRSQIMEEHARNLEVQLAQSMKALEDYKNLTEERFNKLAKMISGK